MSQKKITIGYVRTSTPKQLRQRQVLAIKEKYPEAVIIEEVYTGTSFNRPQWKKVLKSVERNDVSMIVFDEISRMSRDAKEGYETYQYFLKKNVEMVFLREPHLNSETYRQAKNNKINIKVESGDKYTDDFLNTILESVNQYMLNLVEKQIELAFERSQQEVDYIRERTKAGLRAARARGVTLGRKKGSTIKTKKYKKCAKIIYANYKLFGGKLYASSVIKLCDNISRSTFYRYLNIMLDSGEYPIPDEYRKIFDDNNTDKAISIWELRNKSRKKQKKTCIKKHE